MSHCVISSSNTGIGGLRVDKRPHQDKDDSFSTMPWPIIYNCILISVG